MKMLTEFGEYMNKLSKGLLIVSLAATLIGTAAACGDSSSWKGTDFTDYGTVITETNGGFVAETSKYVYFINGIESSSADNSYGTPVKGTLVAADKTDFSKTQVVIPELMAASDYDAGVYLASEGSDVYAYYGTPNTEKDSSGAVASSELTFKKTRLDGQKSEKLFTVSSLSVNYRIAQAADGAVYIVYYDTDDSALISYNCSTKKSVVLGKTDAKNNEKEESGEYLSLGDYKFLDSGSDAQVVYTKTVYTQEYYSEQEEEEDSYSRQTATYNYMYLYTVGKDAVCIKDGKTNNETYAIKSLNDGYLFYTATPLVGKEKTFGFKNADYANEKEIFYTDNVKDGMIINDFDSVYYLDSDAGKVVKNTLIKDETVIPKINEFNVKATIIEDETVSTLLAVDSTYIYCFNSDGYIVAINYLEDKTVRLSERTASASWYKPETVVLSETAAYLFYCDSSTDGNSYIHYSDLTKIGAPVGEDTDDDGEDDLFYLEGAFVGVMPAADRAAVVSSKIAAIASPLSDLEEAGDGKYKSDAIAKARAAYDALDDAAKENVSEDDLAKLKKAEKAIDLAEKFGKLQSVINFENLSEDEKTALKAAYNDAKSLSESYGDDYSEIADYLGSNLNLNYYYQYATEKFSA